MLTSELRSVYVRVPEHFVSETFRADEDSLFILLYKNILRKAISKGVSEVR